MIYYVDDIDGLDYVKTGPQNEAPCFKQRKTVYNSNEVVVYGNSMGI